MRLTVLTGVGVAVVIRAATAAAQPVPPTIDHAALGYQFAAEEKYEQALVEFEQAYRDTAESQLLFAMGRIHALRGDCARARDHFHRFLDTGPGPKSIEATNAEIERCQPAADVVNPPDPAIKTDVDPAMAITDPHLRGHRSFASSMVHDRFVQIGAATAVVAGGVFVYSMYLSCWDGVCEGSYNDFTRKRDRAPVVGITAGALGLVAGGLITTGIVRYALRSDDESGFETALAPSATGATLVIAGRF
jgi:hypothetical protein